MKTLSLSLFILASVFLLSFAFPEGKKTDQSLVNLKSSRENEKPLQRRRPPIKIPGPKLSSEETDVESITQNDSKMKQLSDDDKGKKRGKKDSNLTKPHKNKEDMAPVDNDSKGNEKGKKGQENKDKKQGRDRKNEDKEETQEERSSLL